MSNVRDAIAILNELLNLEQSQLAVRVVESDCFVSSMTIDDAELLKAIVDAAGIHSELLVNVIAKIGGSPGLRTADIHTAHLHFQQLQNVLPMLVAEQERIVAIYRQAAERVVSVPEAANIAGRILARHEDQLAALRTSQTA